MAILLWTLPSCSSKPASAVTPSIVGVVESTNGELNTTTVVRLADGSTFDIAGAEVLVGGRPFYGELLLAGDNGGDRWYYPLGSRDLGSACPFVISDGEAWEEEDAIIFEVGIRLLKAPDYRRPEPQRDVYDRSLFCVNKDGRVLGVPEDLDDN